MTRWFCLVAACIVLAPTGGADDSTSRAQAPECRDDPVAQVRCLVDYCAGALLQFVGWAKDGAGTYRLPYGMWVVPGWLYEMNQYEGKLAIGTLSLYIETPYMVYFQLIAGYTADYDWCASEIP